MPDLKPVMLSLVDVFVVACLKNKRNPASEVSHAVIKTDPADSEVSAPRIPVDSVG
jgi:hypothetical protein